MDKDLALQVWEALEPLPASLLRLRFNGRSQPVYSVAVNAQEMTGKDLHAVLKVAEKFSLDTRCRGLGDNVEIVVYRETAAS